MARCHCVTQMISGIKNYPAHRHNSSLYCSVFKERVARCDFDILANILLSVKRFSEINFSRPRRHLSDVGYLTTPFPLCQHFFQKLFCCTLFFIQNTGSPLPFGPFLRSRSSPDPPTAWNFRNMDLISFPAFRILCDIGAFICISTTALYPPLQMFRYCKKSILHFMKKTAIYIYTFQFTSAIINIKKLIGIFWR